MVTWAGFVSPLAYLDAPPFHRNFLDKPELWLPVEIADRARIDAYTVVCQGTERPTRIGAAWLMSQVHVGHDVWIGDGSIVCPMSSIAGHVTVGENVRIDQGVTIKPFVKVGDGARLGMGAVVIRDVPAGEIVVGNPAKAIRRDA
jgi:UDP-N-acetylglucosamine acyltransferase